MGLAIDVYVVLMTFVIITSGTLKLYSEIKGTLLDDMPVLARIEDGVMTLVALLGVGMMCGVWINAFEIPRWMGVSYVGASSVYILISYWLPKFLWVQAQTSSLTSAILCAFNGILFLPMFYMLLGRS